VLWPLAGIALTVNQDMHGPPLLVGFGLGALLLGLDRRRHADDRPAGGAAAQEDHVGNEVTSGPQSGPPPRWR
jgi:hypothetical protein